MFRTGERNQSTASPPDPRNRKSKIQKTKINNRSYPMSRRPPLRSPRLLLLTALSLAMLQWTTPGAATVRQRLQAAEADGRFVRQLEEFGPVATPAEAQAAWDVALEQCAPRAALVVPAASCRDSRLARCKKPLHSRGPGRTKPASRPRHGRFGTARTDGRPSPAAQWLLIQRQLRLPRQQSAALGTHPMLTLDSKLVYGSTSYLD